MNESLLISLIHDDYFGIYTRNGLEYILSNEEKRLRIFLLDFNNVKELNRIFGYIKVNDIFKKAFSELKDNFLIGRAFSGDEIFVCTENLNYDITILRDAFKNHGLEFKFIDDTFDVKKDNIKEILNFLINKLHG